MSFMSCSKLFARLLTGILLAGAGWCQSLTIVSGDGQALSAATIAQPLIVLVRDASGNPLPNATVTWAVVTPQGGNLTSATSKTDSTGQATNSLLAAPSLPQNASFFQTQINAVYSTKTVTFTETVIGRSPGGGPGVELSLRTPSLGYTFVGAAGQQSSTIIQVLIQGVSGVQTGQPVGHLLIQVAPANKAYTSTLTCAEGANLFTSIQGIATCTPVFGGAVGSGQVLVTAGGNPGILGTFEFNYQVTVGPPAIITAVAGNNQQGQPGQPLPRPLQAQVTDIAGNPLPGLQLVFKAAVPGTVGFSSVNNVSDVHGEVSAIATPSTTASGPIRVIVSTGDGKVFATFTINVIVKIGQILKSGDQQTGLTLQLFANPLIVTVLDSNGNPVAGAQVLFTVVTGAATLGSISAVPTNAQGQASTTVAAGSTPGPLVITATVQGATGTTVATFNLTVKVPGPNCTPGQTFFNGAGLQANYISPGGVAIISCVGLAQGIQGAVSSSLFGPLPTQVAGVSVTFATTSDPTASSTVPNTPIYNVSNYNGQESVMVQVPVDAVVGASVPVIITVAGISGSASATILSTAPGVFEFGPVGADGNRPALILRPDGSVVSPSNALARGEIGRAYVTGFAPPAGLTTNAQLPIDTDIEITTPVIVGVNNAGVKEISVKYARGLVGIWEVQFEVPTSAKTGSNLPFAVAVPVPGGLVFSQTSDIAIQ